MSVIRKEGRVRGRVQGVGFRFFTERTARPLGVTGWVRNCMDGSVEFQVQGPAEKVKQFICELREGPPFGRVDSMDVSDRQIIEGEAGFSIRY